MGVYGKTRKIVRNQITCQITFEFQNYCILFILDIFKRHHSHHLYEITNTKIFVYDFSTPFFAVWACCHCSC